METRKLNFNAPLLSVRRFASPITSSELVQGKPVDNPKPNRQQSLPVCKSDWEIEQVTKPAAIPFQWEQIPGKPKAEVESSGIPPALASDVIRRYSSEVPRIIKERVSSPSFIYNSGEKSSDQNIYKPQVESFSFSDHASLVEKLNQSLNCRDESDDTNSGDDVYSDALETLSRIESPSFNYSMSGLSGCQSSNVKPSGNFSIDTQTRDFMMSRFLPAAKAAVLEKPSHVSKKQSITNKQSIHPEKDVTFKQHSSTPYHTPYNGKEEREYQEPGSPTLPKKSLKVWGILPRFCLKNSLCMFNPWPGVKLKIHPPAPSWGKDWKRTRNAYSGPMEKISSHTPRMKRFNSGLLARDTSENEKKLMNDPSLFLNSFDSYKPGLSPLRTKRSGSISPYRNESPKSPFSEGVGFLGLPKKEDENNDVRKIASSRRLLKAIQTVSRNQTGVQELSLRSNFTGKPDFTASNLSKVEVSVDIPAQRFKFADDTRHMGNTDSIISFVKETSSTDMLKNGKNPNPKSRSTDNVRKNDELNPSLVQEIRFSGGTQVPSDVYFCDKEDNSVGSADEKEFDPACSKSPLPPPLPKTPSESWLWRTLPSTSLANPFFDRMSRNQHQSKKKDLKSCQSESKWETIVKTSKPRHDHKRYSEELTPKVYDRPNKL